MPCGKAGNLALQHGGTWTDDPQVLVVGLSKLSSAIAVHSSTLSSHHPLGARTRFGGDAKAPGSHARGIKAAAADRRAPVRHLESLDGRNTLPDQNAAQGQNRDEFACAGLQHEACDKPPWNKGATAGDHGVGRSHLLFIVTTVADAPKTPLSHSLGRRATEQSAAHR